MIIYICPTLNTGAVNICSERVALALLCGKGKFIVQPEYIMSQNLGINRLNFFIYENKPSIQWLRWEQGSPCDGTIRLVQFVHQGFHGKKFDHSRDFRLKMSLKDTIFGISQEKYLSLGLLINN